ncbi:hypothetical protein BDR07DRAFT_1492780 [Suillus spraguei]|nr:hypothetical protein BDR07DRAFT_1492780 [Suillus spraguei]
MCARRYEQCIAQAQALDEQQVRAGQQDALRDEAAIGTRMQTYCVAFSSQFARILLLVNVFSAHLAQFLQNGEIGSQLRPSPFWRNSNRRYCNSGDTDKAEPIPTAHVVDGDPLEESSGQELRNLTFERRSISEVAADLIQAVQEEDISTVDSPVPISADSFSRITINDLLDYSCIEEWLGSFYKVAI